MVYIYIRGGVKQGVTNAEIAPTRSSPRNCGGGSHRECIIHVCTRNRDLAVVLDTYVRIMKYWMPALKSANNCGSFFYILNEQCLAH